MYFNPMMMFYDPLYMIVLVIMSVMSFGATRLLNHYVRKGDTVLLRTGLSGAEVAVRLLRSQGITDVAVVRIAGKLSDNYDPRTKVLSLSGDVYDGRTASAAGVAAHEAGHAIQHAHHYAPLTTRSALIPVANIGSQLGIWLIMGSFLLGSFMHNPSLRMSVLLIGVVAFSLGFIVSLVTLPVEFNASRRAVALLSEAGIVTTTQERKAVIQALMAAACTYVVAALGAFLQVLVLLIRLGLLRDRD